jgi:1-acyl-sn-glycerol-3-phosphate acyltransferase
MKLISAFFVFSTKIFSKIFYRTHANWLTPLEHIQWSQLRLVVVLNHTSLFEPLFLSAIPNNRLWKAIDRVVVPVADVTLNRPFVGFLFRKLVPNAVAITRKRDDTWTQFMQQLHRQNSLVLIFPEGRMKRKDGLDKNGKPMSVKGGVAEILENLTHGQMLIAYSGGLHHVQAPGEWIPGVFKKIEISFEQIDISNYKKDFTGSDFRKLVITDLESRMAKYC